MRPAGFFEQETPPMILSELPPSRDARLVAARASGAGAVRALILAYLKVEAGHSDAPENIDA
jgi:hypothetical protein